MSRVLRITAGDIAHALGGRRAGKGFVARCPAHDDTAPSLSIADGADGKILVKCFAGCTQASVIAELVARGLWPTPIKSVQRPFRMPVAASAADDSSKRRSEFALSIWEQGVPIKNSLAEHYLRSRGITIEPLPPTLRFHPRLKHGPSSRYWPAMVALIVDGISGQPVGLHRTFLDRDGNGKAPLNNAKLMLGIAKGGVIRLAESTDKVMLTEGIETGLSVLQATGVPTWAALSTSGLTALNLPPGIVSITIVADGDVQGETAALAAARRLKTPVRDVRIVRVPRGSDCNDLIRSRGDHSSEQG